MPNTGFATVTTLDKENTLGNDTGISKPNVPSDPNYVPRSYRPDLCPIVYDTACPTEVGYTFSVNTLYYDFSMPYSSYNNPAIVTVRVQLLNSGTPTGSPQIFTKADMDYNIFSGTFTGLAAGTYTLSVSYLDASSIQMGSSCPLVSL